MQRVSPEHRHDGEEEQANHENDLAENDPEFCFAEPSRAVQVDHGIGDKEHDGSYGSREILGSGKYAGETHGPVGNDCMESSDFET